MYHQGSGPTVILSSLRPPGRRAFTCGHELGHHVSGDGTRVDQLVGQWQPPTFDSREFAADCFAGGSPDAQDGRGASLRAPRVED